MRASAGGYGGVLMPQGKETETDAGTALSRRPYPVRLAGLSDKGDGKAKTPAAVAENRGVFTKFMGG